MDIGLSVKAMIGRGYSGCRVTGSGRRRGRGCKKF